MDYKRLTLIMTLFLKPFQTVVQKLFTVILATCFIVGCAQNSASQNTTAENAAFLEQQTKQIANESEERGWARKILGNRAVDSLKVLFEEPKNVELSREEIANFPYAATYVKLEDQARALVVLGKVTQQQENADSPLLSWVSADGEIIEILNGKIQSFSGFRTDISAGYNAEVQKPLSCYIRQIVAKSESLQLADCAEQADYRFDLKLKSPLHYAYQPHEMFYRIAEPVKYQLSEHNVVYPMPGGRDVRTTTITETALNNKFTNIYRVEQTTGYVVYTKQWLGEKLGYIELTTVKAYLNKPTTTTPESNSKISRHLKIQVEPSNAPQRLLQLLPLQQPTNYAPLTRLYRCDYDHKFAARKLGMKQKLLMLKRIYQVDNKPEYEQQVQKLLSAFEAWPLRPSLIFGFQHGLAANDLAFNPVLPADEHHNSCKNTYHVVFNQALERPVVLDFLNAANNENMSTWWVIQADGQVIEVAANDIVNKPELHTIIKQPNAVVFRGIPDTELPKGFTDINYQLALLLKHWRYNATN